MNNQLKTKLDIKSDKFRQNSKKFIELIDEYKNQEQNILKILEWKNKIPFLDLTWRNHYKDERSKFIISG